MSHRYRTHSETWVLRLHICPGHAGLLERDNLLFVRLVPKLVPLQRGAVCLVQLRREAIPLIREEVPIAIHGHLDGGVAEVNLDGLGTRGDVVSLGWRVGLVALGSLRGPTTTNEDRKGPKTKGQIRRPVRLFVKLASARSRPNADDVTPARTSRRMSIGVDRSERVGGDVGGADVDPEQHREPWAQSGGAGDETSDADQKLSPLLRVRQTVCQWQRPTNGLQHPSAACAGYMRLRLLQPSGLHSDLDPIEQPSLHDRVATAHPFERKMDQLGFMRMRVLARRRVRPEQISSR
jgi:hypothetical protein